MPAIDQSVFNRKHLRPIPAGAVLTPGGYRHSSLVHHMPHGHRIRRRKQQLQVVLRRTQRIVARHDVAPSDAPIPGLGSGWITFASWQNPAPAPISQIATDWTVPNPPAAGNRGQTIFLFNALQNASRTNLLQPLLQWGTSQAGGGPFWSISNWYIDPSGHVCHSDFMPVLPGQVLTGIISLGQETSGLFSYVVSFDGYPTLDLSVMGIEELVCASETLEAYQIGGCTEYPAATFTAMYNIAIAVGGIAPALTWSIQNNSTTCGEHAVIASSTNPGGQINIVY
jgi:hypothetical protein